MAEHGHATSLSGPGATELLKQHSEPWLPATSEALQLTAAQPALNSHRMRVG